MPFKVKYKFLKFGWNGYAAPVPSEQAIITAKNFIEVLLEENYEPKRITPSAVGGIGITYKNKNKRVYVEFYNNGKVLALFSDGESEPRIDQIEPEYKSFKKLITEMQNYLRTT